MPTQIHLGEQTGSSSTSLPSPETNYTHPTVFNNSHVDSPQVFINDVNRALDRARGQGGNHYARGTVLFVRWENDVFLRPGVNNGIQGEIDRLEQVLDKEYGFDTETWPIPSKNSQLSLMRRVMDFQEAHSSVDELLIFYYGGHGAPNRFDQSIWSQGEGPTIEWYSIQPILEHAAADVVILLDCCFAASAGLNSVNGSVEILAACGRELRTIGPSDWSFTNRLTEVLHEKRNQRFTIAELHSCLVNYRTVTGAKKLLRTPVHGIMSETHKSSIKISAFNMNPDHSIQDPTEMDVDSQVQDDARTPSSQSHRVLISVSIDGNLDAVAWRNWLTNEQPSGIGKVSLEGIWHSHSSLCLFSLPVAVWDMLPNKLAYWFVGFVTSPNLAGERADRLALFSGQSIVKPLVKTEIDKRLPVGASRIRLDSDSLRHHIYKAASTFYESPKQISHLKDTGQHTMRKEILHMGSFQIDDAEIELVGSSFSTERALDLAIYRGKHILCHWQAKSSFVLRKIDIDEVAREQDARIRSFNKVFNAKDCFSQCIGYFFHQMSGERLRFGYAYQIPEGVSIHEVPHKLSELLPKPSKDVAKTPRVDLSSRFGLARTLASAIFDIHSAGWVHGDLTTQNILLWRPKHEHVFRLCVVGLLRLSPEFGRDISLSYQEKISHYRHPAITNRYEDLQLLHDIYSLGIIMYEIGFWIGFSKTFFRPGEPLASIRHGNNLNMLLFATGQRYTEVILACLGQDFQALGSHDKHLQAFEERILKPLAFCTA